MPKALKAPIVVAAGIVLAGLAYFALRPGPSDQILIQNALDSAIEAGREGRPGSVLEYLSNSFEINGQQIANRTEVARFIRDQKPDVEVQSTLATVNGETAVIETPIKLELSGPLKMSTTIPNVRIEFQKEQTMRFLVIPSRDWKLTKITVPAESWAQIMTGL